VARAVRSGTRVDNATLAVCAAVSLLVTILPQSLRENIAAGLRRTVVAPLLSLQHQAERARNALVERDAVNARIDSLTLRNDRLAELAYENERLRRLIGLGGKLGTGFVAAEALHPAGRAEGDMVMLTVGSNVGVVARAPVVAPDGLVGMVTTVDPRMSLAILWTHPDFRASAMAADGSAFGIVQPHQGGEPDRFLLEMRGVNFRSALEKGTLVTTSGLGGVYPRGIPIGVVVDEVKTIEGWARTYLLRPSVRPQDVTNVMVLLPQRLTTEIASVWSSAASADSAVRRIAAAGDSMARLEARERAERQRQLDSATMLLNGVNVAPKTTPADSLRPRAVVPGVRRDTARRDTTRRPRP
jgi:rod shape-determining protein MreC